ncbi:hypothetical protein [Streptomyces klenkii]|uniref:hypothetical protein n=1 Tax=Streptomyces klenkii TaxID=1420899 RepID=UPI0034395142
MIWVGPTLWGLFGGFAIEALDLITAVRRHQRWPWLDKRGRPRPGPLAYSVAAGLRLVVGAGVACAAATSVHDRVTPWLAMGLGAAAPVVLEKLTALIPLLLRGCFGAMSEHLGQSRAGVEPSTPATRGSGVEEVPRNSGSGAHERMPLSSTMLERNPERS